VKVVSKVCHYVLIAIAAVCVNGPVAAQCAGDCDGNGSVTVSELITIVNIALGNNTLSACRVVDADGNGTVSISEIIAAVNLALNSCTAPTAGISPTPTPTSVGATPTQGVASWRVGTGLPDASSPLYPFGALAVGTVPNRTVYAALSIQLYLGLYGIYRSEDLGLAWTPTSADFRVSNTGALVVDPTDSDIAYAIKAQGGPLLKTTDRGATWIPHTDGLPGSLLGSKLAIDPDNPDVMYLTSSLSIRGTHPIYKSIDGGEHWVPMAEGLNPPSSAITIAIDPADSETLYVTGYDGSPDEEFGQLAKTTNGGTSWERLDPQGLGENVISILVIDPSNSSTLYAAGDPNHASGIFKSTNGGATWMPASNGLLSSENYLEIQALIIDPTTPQRLYLANKFNGDRDPGPVFVSTDGAASWAPLANPGLEYSQGTFVGRPEVFALVLDSSSSPKILYAATDRGVFATKVP